MAGDLHCHTKLSDGSSDTIDLISYAARIGLDAVAMTNHDTIDGVNDAVNLGKAYGVRVIPGVEISAIDSVRGTKVHLLCYNYRREDEIRQLCGDILKSRREAGEIMIERAMKMYPLTYEHVMHYARESCSIYKQHIMRALMDLGYSQSIFGPVFKRLFSSKSSENILEPVKYSDIRDVIRVVKRSGGKAVIAHPAYYGNFELIDELIRLKVLDGIEVMHPRNPDSAQKQLLETAVKHGLIVTGGSDFHGMNSSTPVFLGMCTTGGEMIKRLME